MGLWRDKYCHVKKPKYGPYGREDTIWLGVGVGGSAAKTLRVIFVFAMTKHLTKSSLRLCFDLWFEGTDFTMAGQTQW